AAVAPADDADALAVDFGILPPQHVDRRDHVVDLGAAVVDRVVVLLAVADAAAVFRRDDYIAARHGVADIWNVVFVQVPADVFVHPHERRTASARRAGERTEDERRHVEAVGGAAIGDLLHPHVAF